MFDFDSVREFVGARCDGGPITRSGLRSRTAGAPKFSIVMPSFNQARFIERSVLSVINQDYPGTELIVVDGGSRDDTARVLDKYADDIDVRICEPDRGQSDALNKGFARATGDIYGWLNSDDLYCPGAFEHAARIFRERPETQVVYGDWYTIGEDDSIQERYLSLACSRKRLITEGFFCNAQAMFWRAELHEQFGEFDIRLHRTMDYDLMLRLTMRAGERAFYRTGRPLGCFRRYAGQKTSGFDQQVRDEHWLIAQNAGVTWKYSWAGRALRLAYRLTRVGEYLESGGGGYVWWKLTGRNNPYART
jgi:glycosyltransferase involved in cell wall biosynthesis